MSSKEAEQGTGIWNRQFCRGWAMGKPTIRDSVLYVGTSNDKVLVAFDPYNGNVIWETKLLPIKSIRT